MHRVGVLHDRERRQLDADRVLEGAADHALEHRADLFLGEERGLDVDLRELGLAVGGPEVAVPMERMAYAESMERFGTDRPDLRFGLELVDLGSALAEMEFKVRSASA